MSNVNKPTAGQEVAVIGSTYGHVMHGYTVVGVSPKGRVTIRRNAAPEGQGYRMFGPDHREMNGFGRILPESKYSRDYLCFDIAGLRAAEAYKQKAQNAAALVRAVTPQERASCTWGKEGLLAEVTRLQALLDAARAAVEAL